MSISLEPISADHLDSPALRALGASHPEMLGIEPNGGLARAILLDGEIVGLIVVLMPAAEPMIAVHHPFSNKGIATEAITLMLPLARALGLKKLSFKTKIDRASGALALKFGAREVGRSASEICWEAEL
jgi:RimJ/RimL family protein N-acetyltransferase